MRLSFIQNLVIRAEQIFPDLEIFAKTHVRQKNRRKVGLVSRPTMRKMAARGILGG